MFLPVLDPRATRARILAASIELLTQRGLPGWTVDEVARRARCAKGLVNYHFTSKSELLDWSAGDLATLRREARFEPFSTRSASAALDRLWIVLRDDVDSGRFAASVALAASGFPRRRDPTTNALCWAAAQAFGVPVEALPGDVALFAVLDGLELQLLAGFNPEAVLEAYHRIWLGLLQT